MRGIKMSNKKYLDYAGLKRVLAKLLPGARKIWHGTEDEWNQLTAAERDKYDQAEIIDENDLPEMIRNPDWSRAVEPTMAQIKAGWTAPEDGIFIGYWNGQLDGKAVTIVVNGIVATRMGAGDTVSGATFYGFGNVQVSVNKNDVITFANISGAEQGAVTPTDPQHYIFVPYKVDVVDNRFPANYSAQEQFTGKYWIDGKKIYRKTFNEISAALDVGFTLSTGVDTLVDHSFTLKRKNGSWVIPYYFTATDCAGLYLDVGSNTDLMGVVRGASTIYGGVLKGWVEYTKTTD